MEADKYVQCGAELKTKRQIVFLEKLNLIDKILIEVGLQTRDIKIQVNTIFLFLAWTRRFS